MPHVFLWGRELNVNSDELSTVATLGIVYRLLCITLSVVFTSYTMDVDPHCPIKGLGPQVYFPITAILSIVSLLVFLMLLCATKTSAHHAVQRFITKLSIVEFVCIVYSGFGLYALAARPGEDNRCSYFFLFPARGERFTQKEKDGFMLYQNFVITTVVLSIFGNIGFLTLWRRSLKRNHEDLSETPESEDVELQSPISNVV
jgi:hypothetical protein